MDVNNRKESDSVEKVEQKKQWIYYEGKSTINISVLMSLHQDFKIVKQVLIEQGWMFDKI